jgi:hypothetical protein
MHIAVVEKQEGSDDTHNSLRLCGFVQCLYRGILYTYVNIPLYTKHYTYLTLSSSSSLSLSLTHTYAHMHTCTHSQERKKKKK